MYLALDMLRRTASALGLAFAIGCAKPPPSSSVHPAGQGTVEDQGAVFDVEVGWIAVSAEEVEIAVELTAKSIEQTDKLVIDLSTNGFVVAAGTSQWTGFVQPREHYTHRVTYKMLDDVDSGRATVTLRRSMDGTLLWDTELLFRRDAGSVQLAE